MAIRLWATDFLKHTRSDFQLRYVRQLNAELFRLSPAKAAQLLQTSLKVKEMHLLQLQGKPYYLAYQDEQHTRLLPADGPDPLPLEGLPAPALVEEIAKLHPAAGIAESQVLTAYDDYYYSKHFEKRLPVVRVKMNDATQTWYYADLRTGQIVLKHQQKSRLERWLYHGLHSLDFSFLVYKRPLWDIVVLFLMLGGLSVSGTGLVLTWKWMKRKGKRKKVALKKYS